MKFATLELRDRRGDVVLRMMLDLEALSAGGGCGLVTTTGPLEVFSAHVLGPAPVRAFLEPLDEGFA